MTETIAHGDHLAVESEIRSRLHRLSLEQKVRLLSGRDHWSTYPEPAIGLRSIVVSDGTVGIRGVRWSEEQTSINTPSATAIAASFDPTVAFEAGVVIGDEARRKGVDVVLGPVVNLQRSPYGGRHFEAFSEDPWLSGEIGAAMVAGIQSRGPATTVKHFVANESETDRLNSNSVVGERVLRELYLAPFEQIVTSAGGLGVMSSYNKLNGTLVTDAALLSTVLKKEWGFGGLVVSDWGAIRTIDESGRGGTDLAMPGPRTRWASGLLDAVRQGRVPVEAVDDKVLRLLRLAAWVGALDGLAAAVDPIDLPAPPAAEDGDVRSRLRRIGTLGTVLLRNEPVDGARVLPLAPNTASLAVIGPGAITPRTNGGGSAAVIAPVGLTPLDALREALPATAVRYAEGARPATLVRPLSARHGRACLGDRTGVVLVEFLDAQGSVIGTELRDQPDTLIYGMGYPPGVDEDLVSSIRATTRITVDTDGDYLLAGAGVGHAAITVDGATMVDADLVPINTDAVIGMSLPPQAIIPLSLVAGRATDVAFTYTPAPRTVAALRLGFDTAAPHGDALIAEARELAGAVDVAIVLVGTGPEDEAEGFDRTSLALRGRQDDLVRAVARANPRTVVVVNAGAPVLLPWREDVAAIVLPWFGGQEMGATLADVLTGAVEPGGRLPVTFPAQEGPPLASPMPVDGDVGYREGLHVGYRGFIRAGIRPAYPFGFGLGYTTWALGDPVAERTAAGVAVRVPVRNIGNRAGRQVVQAYLSRPESGVERPAFWYAGSVPVELPAGGSGSAEIVVPIRPFEHWDESGRRWMLEPGTFHVSVGTAADDLPRQIDIDLP